MRHAVPLHKFTIAFFRFVGIGAQISVCVAVATRYLHNNVDTMNRLQPGKLLLSKWTAVNPVARQKHFLVSEVILPETIGGRIEWVEIEAVYTKARQRIDWNELRDESRWRQGWV